MKTNLTETQNDYAVFLPSISGFYATFVGKQRYGEYVDPARVPAGIGEVEALNFLNQVKERSTISGRSILRVMPNLTLLSLVKKKICYASVTEIIRGC